MDVDGDHIVNALYIDAMHCTLMRCAVWCSNTSKAGRIANCEQTAPCYLQRIVEGCQDSEIRIVNHARAAKHRVLEIGRAARIFTQAGQEQSKQSYKNLIGSPGPEIEPTVLQSSHPMAFFKISRWRLMYSSSFCSWRISSKERQYLRKDSEKNGRRW